jgi:hypothetical protein
MKNINLLTLGALAFLPALAAANNIRCGDRIITIGTTRAEVSALCGQPAQVDHGTVYNNAGVVVRGSTGVVGVSGVSGDIEVWTYNFGPDRLMQRIRFDANGTVVAIESLGYGFPLP